MELFRGVGEVGGAKNSCLEWWAAEEELGGARKKRERDGQSEVGA